MQMNTDNKYGISTDVLQLTHARPTIHDQYILLVTSIIIHMYSGKICRVFLFGGLASCLGIKNNIKPCDAT